MGWEGGAEKGLYKGWDGKGERRRDYIREGGSRLEESEKRLDDQA